jgi:hypothetical protein
MTTGELDRDDPYWQAGLPSFGPRAFEDCERLAPMLPDGTRVALMEQIETPGGRGLLGLGPRRSSGRASHTAGRHQARLSEEDVRGRISMRPVAPVGQARRYPTGKSSAPASSA